MRGWWRIVGTRGRVRLISRGGGRRSDRGQVGRIRIFEARCRATSTTRSLEKTYCMSITPKMQKKVSHQVQLTWSGGMDDARGGGAAA